MSVMAALWCETVMCLLEVVAALMAVALCGPCLLACARRLLLGDELLHRAAPLQEADVLGCDEPACPYYKKNFKYLMVPASRRRHNSPNSPIRQCFK